MVRTIFLLGSNDTFPSAIGDFIEASGGCSAGLVFLLPGGELNGKLVPDYEKSLKKHDIKGWRFYPSTDTDATDSAGPIRSASGIVLGGGSSIYYYRRYVSGQLKDNITEAYESGVPIMACCGSVMIVGDTYPLYQKGEGPIECRPALGLLSDYIFGIHFDKSRSLGHLLDNMAKTGISRGLGLGVKSWVIFKDGEMIKTVGDIYKIRMLEAKSLDYSIEELHA